MTHLKTSGLWSDCFKDTVKQNLSLFSFCETCLIINSEAYTQINPMKCDCDDQPTHQSYKSPIDRCQLVKTLFTFPQDEAEV